jgi:hypothetical protein
VSETTRDDLKLVRAALVAADTKGAPPEARQELRRLLRQHPIAWKIAGDLARTARYAMLALIDGSPGTEDSLKIGFEEMERQLAQDGDGPTERLLIEHVVTCWLDMQLTQASYAQNLKQGMSYEATAIWQQRVTLTHTRYLKALETLARVRKLLRGTVQINIAQSGAQVVNVAGNVRTAEKGT